MRYNRWVVKSAWNDLERVCQTRPHLDVEIVARAKWMIAQLAEDPATKGTHAKFPNDPRGRFRWSKGLLTVIYKLLADADRTVVVEGFMANDQPS